MAWWTIWEVLWWGSIDVTIVLPEWGWKVLTIIPTFQHDVYEVLEWGEELFRVRWVTRVDMLNKDLLTQNYQDYLDGSDVNANYDKTFIQ